MANYNPYFVRPTSNSGYIQVPNIAIGSTWTFESWFAYPLNAQTNWNTLMRGSSYDHQIIVQRSNMHLGMYDNATSTNFNDSNFVMSTLSTGWHHIAVVGSGGKQVYYIDGNLVGQTSKQSTSDVKSIGAYYGDGTQTWGDIDEIRLWNVARTQAQIKKYMYKSLIGTETGLIGYWKCDEGTGVTITDYSTYTRNGALMGTNTWVAGAVDLIKLSRPNINILPTSVFIIDNEIKNIQVNLGIDATHGNTVNYKIILNDTQIYPSTGFSTNTISLPNTLSYVLTSDLLNLGDNTISIQIKNETGLIEEFGDYIIRKENRDTTAMQRNIYNPLEWNTESLVKIDLNGAKLSSYGNNTLITTDNTNFNTIGKRTISSIQIVGNGDSSGNYTYTDNYTNKRALGSGYVSDYELRLNRWTTVNSISVASKNS
jgi:hypothetical protein